MPQLANFGVILHKGLLLNLYRQTTLIVLILWSALTSLINIGMFFTVLCRNTMMNCFIYFSEYHHYSETSWLEVQYNDATSIDRGLDLVSIGFNGSFVTDFNWSRIGALCLTQKKCWMQQLNWMPGAELLEKDFSIMLQHHCLWRSRWW